MMCGCKHTNIQRLERRKFLDVAIHQLREFVQQLSTFATGTAQAPAGLVRLRKEYDALACGTRDGVGHARTSSAAFTARSTSLLVPIETEVITFPVACKQR